MAAPGHVGSTALHLVTGLRTAAAAEREHLDPTRRLMQELEAGFEAFESYFKSSGKFPCSYHGIVLDLQRLKIHAVVR